MPYKQLRRKYTKSKGKLTAEEEQEGLQYLANQRKTAEQFAPDLKAPAIEESKPKPKVKLEDLVFRYEGATPSPSIVSVPRQQPVALQPTQPPVAQQPVVKQPPYATMIKAAEERYSIPTGLLTHLIGKESKFNPKATSEAGAQGLTQLMPKTAEDMGVTNPYDPVQSIEGGAKYLSQQLRSHKGNIPLALAAYNAGPGNVRKYGGIPPFTETQDYVKEIIRNYNASKGYADGGAVSSDDYDLNWIQQSNRWQAMPNKKEIAERYQQPVNIKRQGVIDNNPGVIAKYEPKNDTIYLTPSATAEDIRHERRHRSREGQDLTQRIDELIAKYNRKEAQEFEKDYAEGNLIAQYPSDLDAHQQYAYMAAPDEIQVRLMELRRIMNAQPNKKVTQKDIDAFRSTYGNDSQDVNELLDVVPNDKALLNMLNLMSEADNQQPTVYAATGGWTDKLKETAASLPELINKYSPPALVAQAVGYGYEHLPEEARQQLAQFKDALANAYEQAKTIGPAAPILKGAEAILTASPKMPQGYAGGTPMDNPMANLETGNLLAAAPTVFSRLGRVIEAASPKAFNTGRSASDWLTANLGKYSKAEVEATGLGERLAGMSKTSKEEVLRQINAAQPQVQEVWNESTNKWVKELETKLANKGYTADFDGFDYTYYDQQGNVIDMTDMPESARDIAYDLARFGGRTSDDTKFSQWQLPGGENYKEMLLTLPENSTRAELDKDARAIAAKHGVNYDTLGEEAQREYRRTAISEIDRDRSSKVNFQSGHWAEPNVLAHVRMNDRVSPDGKKTLFVEEIQSDWGQAGRDKGFKRGKTAITDADRQAAKDYFDVAPDFWKTAANEDKDYYVLDMWERQDRQRPPIATYVTDTKQWTQKAIDHIMHHAAENGYDNVAFINGAQSADRYDLSKQISEIHYSGTNLVAYGKNGEDVIRRTGVTEKELPGIIGKEATEKLLSQKPQGTLRSLTGVDLKVGGEGMNEYYDRIVPSVVSKRVKQYGGTTGVVDLGLGGNQVGFDITPEMRSNILNKGFSSFAKGGQVNLKSLRKKYKTK